jgi:L,D-transpeptidase ErfK/SrfK
MDGLRAKWDAWASRGAMVPLERLPVEDAIDANRFVIDSPEQSVVGVPQVVFTREGDALPDFAREYGLGYDEVVAANPDTDIWLPGDNTPVLLPTQFVLPNAPREGVVLNIASKRLFYYPKDSIVRDPETGDIRSQVVLTFPIGIGRVGWETPLGSTLVTAKAVDPHWWVPASVRKEHAEMGDPLPAVVPPGPDNPLGSRVLQLDIPGYLIHGTNKPFGVGMRVSHGCVRLYPENIELLYELVAIGEPVKIINDPYLLGRLGDDWYFEAHAPLEDDTVGAPERLDALLADADDELSAREAEHVRVLASLVSGVPVRISALDDAEVLARVRRVHNTIVHDPDAPTIDEAREMIEEAVAEAELVANVSRRRVSPSGVMPQL